MAKGVKAAPAPLFEGKNLCKQFGHVRALEGVDFQLEQGQVLGLVGDNGAGKSTLIKILTGVHAPDKGSLYFEGRRVVFDSPKAARSLGIETVFQDLALVDQMSIARNFFLGAELVRKVGPLHILDRRRINEVTEQVLREIGVNFRSADEEVAVLSGGERQAIAIGRTIHFGGKLIILDEPTSALSVHETNKVLGYIESARNRGLSVIFITHNLYHVYPIADSILVLERGRTAGQFRRGEIELNDLIELVSRGNRRAAG